MSTTENIKINISNDKTILKMDLLKLHLQNEDLKSDLMEVIQKVQSLEEENKDLKRYNGALSGDIKHLQEEGEREARQHYGENLYVANQEIKQLNKEVAHYKRGEKYFSEKAEKLKKQSSHHECNRIENALSDR